MKACISKHVDGAIENAAQIYVTWEYTELHTNTKYDADIWILNYFVIFGVGP